MLVSSRLKQLRKNSGMTQDEISENIGVALRTYRSYEDNIRDVSTNTLVRIADLFHCSTDYLLGRTDFPNLNAPVSTSQGTEIEITTPAPTSDAGAKITLGRQALERLGDPEAIAQYILQVAQEARQKGPEES